MAARFCGDAVNPMVFFSRHSHHCLECLFIGCSGTARAVYTFIETGIENDAGSGSSAKEG